MRGLDHALCPLSTFPDHRLDMCHSLVQSPVHALMGPSAHTFSFFLLKALKSHIILTSCHPSTHSTHFHAQPALVKYHIRSQTFSLYCYIFTDSSRGILTDTVLVPPQTTVRTRLNDTGHFRASARISRAPRHTLEFDAQSLACVSLSLMSTFLSPDLWWT